jgi:hypothetical protein
MCSVVKSRDDGREDVHWRLTSAKVTQSPVAFASRDRRHFRSRVSTAIVVVVVVKAEEGCLDEQRLRFEVLYASSSDYEIESDEGFLARPACTIW